MFIIDRQIGRKELTGKYMSFFKTMIKAVVDVKKRIIAVDADLHADLETLLIEQGSKQEDIWGINFYPFKKKEDFIEYTSFINIRPHMDNRGMEVMDTAIKKKIESVTEELIDYGS